MTQELKTALEVILNMLKKKKPQTLKEAIGMLAIVEVIAETALLEEKEKECAA